MFLVQQEVRETKEFLVSSMGHWGNYVHDKPSQAQATWTKPRHIDRSPHYGIFSIRNLYGSINMF